MEIHISDLLFIFLRETNPHNFTLTESPGGIKIVEWVYADDKMFIGIFSADNQLITWHIE